MKTRCRAELRKFGGKFKIYDKAFDFFSCPAFGKAMSRLKETRVLLLVCYVGIIKAIEFAIPYDVNMSKKSRISAAFSFHRVHYGRLNTGVLSAILIIVSEIAFAKKAIISCAQHEIKQRRDNLVARISQLVNTDDDILIEG